MASITTIKKKDKVTGKDFISYRAFIRRTISKGKHVSKSKVFLTKAQAKDWVRNFESDSSLAKLTKGHGTTFADVAEEFTKAPPTRGTKYWAMSHLDFWLEQFGTMKINDISRGDINTGRAKLSNKTAMRTSPAGLVDTGVKITPATVNRYLASLSSVFNFALDRDIIDIHPMKSGNVRKLKEGKGRKRILTADEEDRLLAAADESTWPMMRLFLRTLLTTAARKSEVLNLQWRDVDLSESVALLHDTKNGDTRALPLVDDVRETLKDAKKVRPLHSDFVFYDPRHPDRPKNIDVIWKCVRDRAGLLNDREDKLDCVVLHSTRHTAVTKLIMGGANIAQAATVSGHKTLAMLKRYTHGNSKDSVGLAQRLLSGKGDK